MLSTVFSLIFWISTESAPVFNPLHPSLLPCLCSTTLEAELHQHSEPAFDKEM